MKRTISTLFLLAMGFQIAFTLNVYTETTCLYTVNEIPATGMASDLLVAEIVINEILPNGTVELKNIGDESLDVSDYWLCNFPGYVQIGNLDFVCGAANIGAGEIVAVEWPNNVGSGDGEMGIYTSNNFGSPTAIIDYVEWGSTGHQRAAVAIAAGIWDIDNFAPAIPNGQSLIFDGNGNTANDWSLAANPSICNENMVAASPEGGNLTTTDTLTELTICAGDGVSDAFDVILTGNEGTNSAWVITDDSANILALPPAPPFDLEGAGGGICLVWHLSFEDGLQGAEVGLNANDLMGEFDLSNPITVIRNGVNGGNLTTADTLTELTICAGDGMSDAFDVILTGNEGANSAWVITDDSANILALPPAPPFDLEGAGGGTCLVWHLSFEDGLQGAEVGMNANDLVGCFDLSNPITVIRNGVAGGNLMTADTLTELTICAGDGMSDAFDVILTGNEGANSGWVITDDSANILALPAAPPFDLEGAGGGTCLVWHLSFEDGLQGAEVGMNANDLMGCFDLSNPITVIRNGVNGGNLTTADTLTELTICAGDGMSDAFDVILTGNEGTNSAWVITDALGNILALPAAPPFDLEGAGDGVCLVWHLSYEDGLEGAEVGLNANDLSGCFDLSNPITVDRNGVNGGDLIMTNGFSTFTICAGDGIDDPINVSLSNVEGANRAWVITDDAGEILALPANPPFNLEGAGEGTCLIWNLSFEDGLQGAEVGLNANDLEGCFDLSNPITVIRVVNEDCENICNAEGGEISTDDPTTICAGDGIGDPIDVTLTGNVGANSAWVITDDAGTILALPAAPPFDLEGAGAGICLIWHLTFDTGLVGAELGLNANDLEGCFDLSNPITVVRNGVEGGNLTTTDTLTELTICAGDGMSDAFDVILTGNVGANSAWVITDDSANILALPDAPPFDLEGAGGGTCLIWHLSFEDGLVGAEVGLNANDLEGCFDLSNPITVIRNGVDGGDLMTTDTLTELTICAGDGVPDEFDVILTGNVGTNSAWVITDDSANILALPPAPPFDLEGAGGGTCLVWHLSFEDGLQGAEVGMNANDLQGCFDLSNPITVIRNGVNGGDLITEDSLTEVTICAGDGIADPIDVILTGDEGANSAWVITDDSGEILALPAAPPFDLEGAGPGLCFIWHLSFADGLEGAEVGQNAGELMGCFDLSNAIAVTRTAVDGGTVATVDGETEIEICVGDGEADSIAFENTSTEGLYQYVVTDDNNFIVGLPDGNIVDFEGAGFGVCRLWGLSYTGNLLAELGDDAAAVDLSDDCFVLSENFVTVIRDTTGENCVTPTFEINPSDVQVSLQPNPVQSDLLVNINFETIKENQMTVEVFNMVGSQLSAEQHPAGRQVNVRMDVQTYPPGMYLLKITNGNRIISRRFVKQ
ncbi:MAG: T9SS type A sorting domain-containing protein [Bacteroidota bacterium]